MENEIYQEQDTKQLVCHINARTRPMFKEMLNTLSDEITVGKIQLKYGDAIYKLDIEEERLIRRVADLIKIKDHSIGLRCAMDNNASVHTYPRPSDPISGKWVTVQNKTTNTLIKKYKKLKIIFSPEFLTERTSKLDMLTQSRIILGGEKNLTKEVKKLYYSRFKNKNVIEMNSITAELVKYMNNSFFATKVSIMNEFKLVSDKIGANWEDALHGFSSDGRIGDSHLNVPGHDGNLGYGGKCFPKDICALIDFAKKNQIELNTIIGGWKTNNIVRKKKN